LHQAVLVLVWVSFQELALEQRVAQHQALQELVWVWRGVLRRAVPELVWLHQAVVAQQVVVVHL
tara:strand:- start:158 stop:349 length:192 start_codon:yes stop_codon:yes gene_type:complete